MVSINIVPDDEVDRRKMLTAVKKACTRNPSNNIYMRKKIKTAIYRRYGGRQCIRRPSDVLN